MTTCSLWTSPVPGSQMRPRNLRNSIRLFLCCAQACETAKVYSWFQGFPSFAGSIFPWINDCSWYRFLDQIQRVDSRYLAIKSGWQIPCWLTIFPWTRNLKPVNTSIYSDENMGFPSAACVWLAKGTCHSWKSSPGRAEESHSLWRTLHRWDTGWFEGTTIFRNLHILPVTDNLYQFVVRYCHIVFSLSHNMIHQSFINRLSIVRQPFNQQLSSLNFHPADVSPGSAPRVSSPSPAVRSLLEELGMAVGRTQTHAESRGSYIIYNVSYIIPHISW